MSTQVVSNAFIDVPFITMSLECFRDLLTRVQDEYESLWSVHSSLERRYSLLLDDIKKSQIQSVTADTNGEVLSANTSPLVPLTKAVAAEATSRLKPHQLRSFPMSKPHEQSRLATPSVCPTAALESSGANVVQQPLREACRDRDVPNILGCRQDTADIVPSKSKDLAQLVMNSQVLKKASLTSSQSIASQAGSFLDTPYIHANSAPFPVEAYLSSPTAQPLDRWRTLIYAVSNVSESKYVKLNTRWFDVLHRDKASLGASDNKSTLMSMISQTVRRNKFASNSSRSGSKDSLEELGDDHTISLKKFCVLHPSHGPRMCWDIFGILMLAHDLVMIPLGVFDKGTDGMGGSYQAFTKRLEIFVIVFWSLDILVSFMTGYYSDEGFVELSHSKIAKKYMVSWLPLDLVIVSTDWVGIVLNSKSDVGYLRLGKTVSRFMRILRLLRFMKINENFATMMQRVNSEFILTMVGVTKLLLGIVIVNHYIACGWYLLSQIVDLDITWSKKFLSENTAMGYAYATSLHWSLTQFTPASMEVHPTNKYERTYTIIVIIGAMVTFSSFVSSITGAMTHLRNVNAKQAEQEASIRRYFGINKISKDLASQVWQFRRLNKASSKKRMKEAEIPALKFLPRHVREQLRFEVYSPILQWHPLFAKYADVCPAAFWEICSYAISERQLLAGEELQELNDQVNFMLFVCYGVLEYHTAEFEILQSARRTRRNKTTFMPSSSEKKLSAPQKLILTSVSEVISHTKPSSKHDPAKELRVVQGQWACEIALWSTMGRTAAPMLGGDHGCELVLLHADRFQNSVQKHRTGSEMMASYGGIFVRRFNNAHEDAEFSNLLFNDDAAARDMIVAAERGVKVSQKVPSKNLGFSASQLSATLGAGWRKLRS